MMKEAYVWLHSQHVFARAKRFHVLRDARRQRAGRARQQEHVRDARGKRGRRVAQVHVARDQHDHHLGCGEVAAAAKEREQQAQHVAPAAACKRRAVDILTTDWNRIAASAGRWRVLSAQRNTCHFCFCTLVKKWQVCRVHRSKYAADCQGAHTGGGGAAARWSTVSSQTGIVKCVARGTAGDRAQTRK